MLDSILINLDSRLIIPEIDLRINQLLEASLRPPVLEAGHIDKNKSFFQKRKIF
jgi:hypothetical protein